MVQDSLETMIDSLFSALSVHPVRMSCSWSAEPIGMPEFTKAEVSVEGLSRFTLLPVPLKPKT